MIKHVKGTIVGFLLEDSLTELTNRKCPAWDCS